MIYIVFENNGEQYEDYQSWIEGVFKEGEKEKAIEFGKEHMEYREAKYFHIEEWDMESNKQINSFTYNRNGKEYK